jgi:streptomycin 6-kinase
MTPRLLATGRAAEVFDLGDGTVLRRYRVDHDTALEARLMQWLHDRGYPVPRVLSASGREMVMERIDGQTMLADMGRRPWRIGRHLRLLAALQRSLGELTAPDWLPAVAHVPAGDAVLHLDLHPLNVLLSPAGPVVIDWTNTARGPAGFDAATSYVVLATSTVDRARERLGRRWAVHSFVGASRDHAEFVSAAAERRLLDPNVTAEERTRIRRLLPNAPTADR